ncbi:hypothetical protein ACO2Q0_02995 [Phenylobacterium sp. VNQ135]|uniref:hypothetical protein n=1 Tax=Phenylobacterium sp. VNQ135 TaxID=3400922 RepID=UPI003C004305
MPVTPNSIITPQTPRSAAAAVSTANTTFGTTPTNTVLLVSAGASGGRLTKLQAIPLETVTANFLQAYRSTDSGTTKYLCAAATGGSDTVSGADGPAIVDFGFSDDNPMLLQANERIYVATGITKNYHFIAEWADY